MVCSMTFWRGATISMIICSAGFHALFLPKFDESKNRAKKNKIMTPIQNVFILLIFNGYRTKLPVATTLDVSTDGNAGSVLPLPYFMHTSLRI
jgi:hypothetical protein